MKLLKKLIGLIVIISTVAFFPIYAEAKEFTGTVKSVPASDSEVSFVFSFNLKQQYDITITDPSGNQFNTKEDASEITIVLDETEAGNYNYVINANNEDFTYSVKAIQSGKTVASVGDSKPVISENVTDLKIWFEDGDLVATWNFSGKVKITVTDPARFNNLESNLVTSDNSYRKAIPDNVDSVQFYIVPATDSKISGSGLTYTREVVRKIAGRVDFPNTPIVNEASVKLPIGVDTGGLELRIYDSGYVPGHSHHNDTSIPPVLSQKVDIGNYEIEVPLVSTDNTIVVMFIDENDNAVTKSYSYTRDMVAPTIDPKMLSLDNKAVYTDYTTTNNEVLISGVVKDEIASNVVGYVSKFYINDTQVEIDNGGRFSHSQFLTLGVNEITLKAVDASGLESEFTINVTMVEEKKSSASKYIVFGVGAVLILLIAFFLVKTIRNMAASKKADTPTKEERKTTNAERKVQSGNENVKKGVNEAIKKPSVEEKRRAEIERLMNGGEKPSK